MPNPFPAIGHFFANLGKALFGQIKQPLEAFLTDFVKSDLGSLATDAVKTVQASMPGATDVQKRDAAVAQLKTDLAKAGHDISQFGESIFNFLIETAVQVALTEGAKLPAILAAI